MMKLLVSIPGSRNLISELGRYDAIKKKGLDTPPLSMKANEIDWVLSTCFGVSLTSGLKLCDQVLSPDVHANFNAFIESTASYILAQGVSCCVKALRDQQSMQLHTDTSKAFENLHHRVMAGFGITHPKSRTDVGQKAISLYTSQLLGESLSVPQHCIEILQRDSDAANVDDERFCSTGSGSPRVLHSPTSTPVNNGLSFHDDDETLLRTVADATNSPVQRCSRRNLDDAFGLSASLVSFSSPQKSIGSDAAISITAGDCSASQLASNISFATQPSTIAAPSQIYPGAGGEGVGGEGAGEIVPVGVVAGTSQPFHPHEIRTCEPMVDSSSLYISAHLREMINEDVMHHKNTQKEIHALSERISALESNEVKMNIDYQRAVDELTSRFVKDKQQAVIDLNARMAEYKKKALDDITASMDIERKTKKRQYNSEQERELIRLRQENEVLKTFFASSIKNVQNVLQKASGGDSEALEEK
jgi:hypothetical protein